MKLSIIITSYNQEQYIAECVDSILFQNIPFKYEIIVADDCSTDATLSIITEKLKKVDANYHVLTSDKNLGISKNYQRAFAKCQGEYIAVIEGDDYWTDPNRLKKHVDFLDNRRECVMSFNRMIEFNEAKALYQYEEWKSNNEYEYITSQQMALGNKIGNLSACVFRNSEIKKIKKEIYEIAIADWMLGLTLGQFGLIAKLKDIMSVYRINPNGQWNKLSVKQQKESIIECIDIYNKALEYKYNTQFEEYRKKLIGEPSIKKKETRVEDFIPPIFLYIIKLLLPVYVKRLMKNI